jgi:hypothetical protein
MSGAGTERMSVRRKADGKRRWIGNCFGLLMMKIVDETERKSYTLYFPPSIDAIPYRLTSMWSRLFQHEVTLISPCEVPRTRTSKDTIGR